MEHDFPQTVAGRRLLDSGSLACPQSISTIIAIETEARAAGLRAVQEQVRALAGWDKARWAKVRGGDPIARTINAVLDILSEELR